MDGEINPFDIISSDIDIVYTWAPINRSPPLLQKLLQRIPRPRILHPIRILPPNLHQNRRVPLNAKPPRHLLPRLRMLVVPAFKHLDTFATVGFTVDLAANVLPDGFVLGAMATLFVVDEAAANVLVADTVELGEAADRRRGTGPFEGIEMFLFILVLLAGPTTTVKRLFITIVRTVPVRVIAHPHRNNNDSDHQQDGHKPIHPIVFVDESERGGTRGTGTGHCKRDTKEIEKRLKRD